MSPNQRVRAFNLLRRLPRYEGWAFIDQCVVSAMNFLSGIILARYLGLTAYGGYVLLNTVLLYANTLQQGFIISPMVSLAPQILEKDKKSDYLNGMLSTQVLACTTVVLAILIFGWGISTLHLSWGLGANTLPLALTTAFFLLQDWLRRYFFVQSRADLVFVNDVISYMGQVLLFLILHWAGKLSVATALWAVAATSALAFGVGVVGRRFRLSATSGLQAIRKSWRMGRDMFVAGQVQWAGSQGVVLLAGGVLGPGAAAGIRVVQNLLGPFNVLVTVTDNIVPAKSAMYLARGGISQLVNYLRRVALLGGSSLGMMLIGTILISRQALSFLYGPEYANYSSLILLGAISFMVAFFNRQFTYFHRSLGSTSALVISGLLSAAITVGLTALLVQHFKETGVFVAALIGHISALVSLAYTAREASVDPKFRVEAAC